MKTSLWVLTLVCSGYFLNACGGGNTTHIIVANHLVVSAPVSGTAGTSLSFTVTAMDVSNNVVTTYTGPVRFTSSDAQATLPGAASLMNGTGSFSAILKTTGGETITAIDTGNPLLMGASNTISVNAAAATHFSLSGQNSAIVGAPYSVTVDAFDAFGNVATGYNGTIHFTSSDPQAILPGNSTLTNGSGTFSVTLKTAASETITATDTVTSSITGTSSPIIVSTTPPPVISTSPAPPVGVVNVAYDFTFTLASGGQAPFTWSETGALPPGLTFNNSTGELSGTPAMTSTPTFPITLQVRDSLGQESAPQGFTIQITLHGFSTTGSMGTARSGHTATVLNSGKVLVVGGEGLASSEMFDPASGMFTAGKNLGTPRARQTATLLKSGKVLIAGGMQVINQATQTLASAELFDPTTGTFTPTNGDLMEARSYHTATLLDDGRVLLTGGVGNSGVFVMTAELFDPTTETFSLTGNMEVARAGHTATLLNNKKVLVAGGGNGNGDFATAEIFDPSTGSFAPTAGSMETARGNHTATLLNDGTVLLAGGSSDASAELFDPNTATFMPAAGNMETLRENHTATLLNDGTVLIAGGDLCCISVRGRPVPSSIATAELYAPASKTFSPTGSLQKSRFFHTASLLNDGTVLVTGGVFQLVRFGQIDSMVLSTAELYH